MDRRIREIARKKGDDFFPGDPKGARTSTVTITQLLLSGGSARRSS
jgi:hypothetical protein